MGVYTGASQTNRLSPHAGMFFYPTGLLSAKGEEEKGDEEMWQRKDLKLQVPVKVTTPRSGPLQLGGRDSLPSPSSPPQRCFTRRRKRSWADPQMPRPLTRNYVPDLCRPPIVVVEQSLLEGLSCADLREEVQLLIDVCSSVCLSVCLSVYLSVQIDKWKRYCPRWY